MKASFFFIASILLTGTQAFACASLSGCWISSESSKKIKIYESIEQTACDSLSRTSLAAYAMTTGPKLLPTTAVKTQTVDGKWKLTGVSIGLGFFERYTLDDKGLSIESASGFSDGPDTQAKITKSLSETVKVSDGQACGKPLKEGTTYIESMKGQACVAFVQAPAQVCSDLKAAIKFDVTVMACTGRTTTPDHPLTFKMDFKTAKPAHIEKVSGAFETYAKGEATLADGTVKPFTASNVGLYPNMKNTLSLSPRFGDVVSADGSVRLVERGGKLYGVSTRFYIDGNELAIQDATKVRCLIP